ncbi:MAG TPA: Asp-tRNA(Asn)/Glu-tRNA(Gln) amidotransferase subunit GatB [Alphaproteobacteria bacterium]|jgi:aspartyl-tRNA(Asn)/glutamyl-tRNA(Gln) amidotransferase subunit B|nr:Asp-tRNA(Asn)/Glu-tRNA(Gln) amidotransferase subunit GatB [Alphaproteobacteria bacterium]
MKYTPIIGLEVHIELNTKTKMFCSCPADHFGKLPNTQTCPVCLGLPGALPFANKEAIDKTIKFGLALGCEISRNSRFYRKNYFYPDLPKGFQTSQLDSPLCVGGELQAKKINHIHLEEDAGKLVHQNGASLVDFNRSSVPLMELVTEPDFHDVESILVFLKEIQLIARYLNISNADMEKGSMRLEANVSLATSEQSTVNSLPDYKVELKNINSFRFLEKAINAEIKRQEEILSNGEKVEQETRGYDEVKQTTYSQRSKADAHDYRYFPEPDLPPISLSELTINNLQFTIPELPQQKRERFEQEYKLPKDYIDILVLDLDRANYFEEAAKLNNNYKLLADLMINKKLDLEFPQAAGFVRKLVELTKVEYANNDEVESVVNLVIMDNEKAVSDYKNGNGNVVGFLIGMVQKRLQGKGNVEVVRSKLLEKIQNG